MNIKVVLTDADIRYHIDLAITELEEDNLIHFTDSESRTEFIEDCVSCEVDQYDLYDRNPLGYCPNYKVSVLDMADLYGYLVEDPEAR